LLFVIVVYVTCASEVRTGCPGATGSIPEPRAEDVQGDGRAGGRCSSSARRASAPTASASSTGSLGIAPNVLTKRLNSLVDAGLLERRQVPGRQSPWYELPPDRDRFGAGPGVGHDRPGSPKSRGLARAAGGSWSTRAAARRPTRCAEPASACHGPDRLRRAELPRSRHRAGPERRGGHWCRGNTTLGLADVRGHVRAWDQLAPDPCRAARS